jgi:hypothetical protein
MRPDAIYVRVSRAMRPADRAWLALGFKPRAKHVWVLITAIVLLYNSTAEDGDLLSEQVDRWLVERPLLTRAVIAVFAAHLSNLMTPRYDIVSLGFVVVRKARWRGRNVRSKTAIPSRIGEVFVISTGTKSSKASVQCLNQSSLTDAP